jgi:hypothetical protein
MNVYFIPLGQGRHEPYFEHEDGDEALDAREGAGMLARLAARFRQTLRDAERGRHHERAHDPSTGVLGRVQRGLLRWIAERVAEQRLLWHLRRVDEAILYVPDSLEAAAAERAFLQGLRRDGDRHLRLLALHAVGLALSAPLVLVPGPNLFGYFFLFTVISHFLAFRGARRGTSRVRWSVVPSAALSELGRALAAAAPERRRLVHDVAERLRLPRLARFVERMAVPTA